MNPLCLEEMWLDQKGPKLEAGADWWNEYELKKIKTKTLDASSVTLATFQKFCSHTAWMTSSVIKISSTEYQWPRLEDREVLS